MSRRGEGQSLLDIDSATREIANNTGIPGRACMWLTSWIFFAASVLLTSEFIVIHGDPRTDNLANFLGTCNCILWVQGFTLLTYWCLYEVPFDFTSTFASVTKLAAAIVFNIQPAAGLIEPWVVDNTTGVASPFYIIPYNFVGICLFHIGNMISSYAMYPLFDSKKPFSEANLAVWGTWILTIATTLLVTADGLDNYNDAPAARYIVWGQIGGAALLGVGSLFFCYWSRPQYVFTKPTSAINAYE